MTLLSTYFSTISSHLERWYRRFPNPLLRLVLAGVHRQAGGYALRHQRIVDALAELERSLTLQSDNWYALHDYRDALLANNDFSNVLIVCDRMLVLAPDDHKTLVIRGRVNEYLG